MEKMQPIYGPFLRNEFSNQMSMSFARAIGDENEKAVIARNEKLISYEYQGVAGSQGIIIAISYIV